MILIFLTSRWVKSGLYILKSKYVKNITFVPYSLDVFELLILQFGKGLSFQNFPPSSVFLRFYFCQININVISNWFTENPNYNLTVCRNIRHYYLLFSHLYKHLGGYGSYLTKT